MRNRNRTQDNLNGDIIEYTAGLAIDPVTDTHTRSDADNDADFPFDGGGTVTEQLKYSNATGGTVSEQEAYSNAGGIKRMFQSIRARKNLKAKAKASKIISKGQATVTKANAKLAQAKAQQVAAKALGVKDTTVVQPTEVVAQEETGMSTGMKIGIGVGVLALIVVGVIVYKKMKHKK